MRSLISIAFLLASFPAISATYYLSTSGSDAASGLSGSPWASWGKAVSNVVAGDTVVVGVGLFSQPSSTAVNGGTSASPITIIGESRDGSIVSNLFTLNKGWWVLSNLTFAYQTALPNNLASNITWTGCTFSGSPSQGIYMKWDVPPAGPSDCLITNCTFENWGDNGVIVLTGYRHNVLNSTFRNNNGYDAVRLWGVSNVFRSCVFSNIIAPTVDMPAYGNHADIWQTFGNANTNVVSSGTLVEKCLFVDGTSQLGNIERNNSQIENWTFRNNIFDRCGGQFNCYAPGFRFLQNTFHKTTRTVTLRFTGNGEYPSGKGMSHNSVVLGNIFAECSDDPSSPNSGFYTVSGTLTNCVADYNMMYGSGGATKTLTGSFDAHGINGGSAEFVNGDARNFSLTASSPCIGASTNLSAEFASDYSGATRTVPWDIGALEYGSSIGGGGSTNQSGVVTATVLNVQSIR